MFFFATAVKKWREKSATASIFPLPTDLFIFIDTDGLTVTVNNLPGAPESAVQCRAPSFRPTLFVQS